MPAVHRNPRLPTLYLDWSHVSDAACSTDKTDKAEWKPLADLLGSGRVNVCLSTVHLLELRAWPDEARATIVASWLDGLDIVWMHSTADQIEVHEAMNALLRVLGAQASIYQPFVGGFVRLLGDRVSPEVAAEMLAQPTVSAFLRGTKGRNMQPVLDFSLSLMEDVSRDRKRAKGHGFAAEDVDQMLLAVQPDKLKKFVDRAHNELMREDGYRARDTEVPRGSKLDAAIHSVLAAPDTLRSARLVADVLRSLAHSLRDKTPGSQNFHKQRSTWFDLAHCSAGGAYCSTFTCDAQTATHLHRARTALGLPPPLSQQQVGGVAALVDAIEAQLAT